MNANDFAYIERQSTKISSLCRGKPENLVSLLVDEFFDFMVRIRAIQKREDAVTLGDAIQTYFGSWVVLASVPAALYGQVLAGVCPAKKPGRPLGTKQE